MRIIIPSQAPDGLKMQHQSFQPEQTGDEDEAVLVDESPQSVHSHARDDVQRCSTADSSYSAITDSPPVVEMLPTMEIDSDSDVEIIDPPEDIFHQNVAESGVGTSNTTLTDYQFDATNAINVNEPDVQIVSENPAQPCFNPGTFDSRFDSSHQGSFDSPHLQNVSNNSLSEFSLPSSSHHHTELRLTNPYTGCSFILPPVSTLSKRFIPGFQEYWESSWREGPVPENSRIQNTQQIFVRNVSSFFQRPYHQQAPNRVYRPTYRGSIGRISHTTNRFPTSLSFYRTRCRDNMRLSTPSNFSSRPSMMVLRFTSKDRTTRPLFNEGNSLLDGISYEMCTQMPYIPFGGRTAGTSSGNSATHGAHFATVNHASVCASGECCVGNYFEYPQHFETPQYRAHHARRTLHLFPPLYRRQPEHQVYTASVVRHPTYPSAYVPTPSTSTGRTTTFYPLHLELDIPEPRICRTLVIVLDNNRFIIEANVLLNISPVIRSFIDYCRIFPRVNGDCFFEVAGTTKLALETLLLALNGYPYDYTAMKSPDVVELARKLQISIARFL